MEQNDLIFIQSQIGYTFNNLDLLQQAFTRRSYSEENGGENNEVLEFIGDKVLDLFVVKLLISQNSNAVGLYKKHDPKLKNTWAYMTEQKTFPDENVLVSDYSEAELTEIKKEYDKISDALAAAKSTGYGIVMPEVDDLHLEEPEIMKQGGRYGVRLKASAPSIHMIRADIETAVSPIVGNEKQSEDMVNYLLQEFEGDTSKIWQSNIFGRSFHELVNDDLQTKLRRMPEDARKKLQETLSRIINEGSGGLICIIL